MPINLVYEYRSRGFLRRLFKRMVHLAGSLLILVCVLTAILLVVTLLALPGSRNPGRDEGNLASEAVVFVISLSLGRWLARSGRRSVLFLRRFGFAGATEALTFAIATAMGSSWRLITLDDHQVTAMGSGGRSRWMSVSGFLVTAAIVALIIFWMFGGGLSKFVGETMAQALKQPGNLLQIVIGAIVISLLVGIFAGLIAVLIAIFFLSLTLFSWGSYMSVRRAERSKTVEILDKQSIERVTSLVLRRSRKVFGPRFVVVRVAQEVWQPAIRQLSSVCAAVIVDISEPTENLLWEIATLKPQIGSHWILVAERTRIEKMISVRNHSGIEQKLLHLLDREDVLAYSNDSSGRRNFARSLRARLAEETPSIAATQFRTAVQK